MMTRILSIGFLGPEGSNSHQAALNGAAFLSGDFHATLKPYTTLSLLLEATREGQHDIAIVPYENALEGAVVEVMEYLGNAENGTFIHAEFLQPICHSLLVHPQNQVEKLHTIYSHAMALNQCQQTLRTRFGRELQLIPTASTAEAAAKLAQYAEADAQGVGVLATQVAAQMNHLKTLTENVSDSAQNVTRFLLVSYHATWPDTFPGLPEAEIWKTSLCVALHEYPGVLSEYLQVFQRYWVNLTKIESRPTRLIYGDYHFFLDAEGRLPDLAEGRLMQELRARSRRFHMQGPYRSLGLPASANG